MRPVIFIDIDGPLIPSRYWFVPSNRRLHKKYMKDSSTFHKAKTSVKFDPACVAYFNLWFKYSNALGVFSTDWTRHCDKDLLMDICRKNGLKFELHEDWLTPKRFSGGHRGNEIRGWLDEIEHDKFLVVDDNDEIKKVCGGADTLEGQYVLVDNEYGITRQDFKLGCNILGIDYETVLEKEMGVKKLTEQEKKDQEKWLEILANSAI